MIDIEQYYNWWVISILMFVGYFLFAGSLYLLLDKKRKIIFSKFKIQKRSPSIKMVKKEIQYSTSTLAIYTLSSWVVYNIIDKGQTAIYYDISQNGVIYFIFSIIIMILIHDTYFYWSHRIIHIHGIFKHIHKVHHLSNNPTAFAAFSFHPLEAIISIGYILIIVFFIPWHPIALFVFLGIMLTINIMGHVGYEFFPKSFMRSTIGKWVNVSTFHNKHHSESKYNFGLYFTFWDHIMGTFKK